jgi:hypothetical protein
VNVRIHIDRLVLHGVDARHIDEDRVAKAVSEHLSERFAEGGTPAGLKASSMRPRESSGHSGLPRSNSADGLGEFVGGALYEGLNK